MNSRDRVRDAITSLEQTQQELQRRFDEEQRKIQETLERKQAQLAERQRALQDRLEREQQRLHERFGMETGGEQSGRDRILEKATELFATRGYLDVSMREIAEASGLRKATIYHHFRDKDELFIAVALKAMRDRSAKIETIVNEPLPLPALLKRMAEMQLTQWDGSMMRIAQDMQEHIPESKHDEIHSVLFGIMDLYTSVFARAADQGEIVMLKPALAGAAFFHLVSAWMWDPFGNLKAHLSEPSDMADLAVNTLLYGIAGPALRTTPAPD
jgi:AcrR family transcriptional regulator